MRSYKSFDEYLKEGVAQVQEKSRAGNRNPHAEQYYPEEITAEEFIALITNKRTNNGFINNMRRLQVDGCWHDEKMLVEEWMETYAAWMRMN